MVLCKEKASNFKSDILLPALTINVVVFTVLGMIDLLMSFIVSLANTDTSIKTNFNSILNTIFMFALFQGIHGIFISLAKTSKNPVLSRLDNALNGSRERKKRDIEELSEPILKALVKYD